MNLRELQNVLYWRITDPDRANEGLRDKARLAPGMAEAFVHGDGHLSAVERIDIHPNAYFYRLLDCLTEEFPATMAVAGDENFAALVREYLLKYPPTEPSILYAGRYLADFLSDHPFGERWPFIAELAGLERAILDVFHAADAPALRADALRAVPSQHWPALELRTHPTVKIIDGEWRVTDLLYAVAHGQEWNDPAHEKTSVLVWRQNAQVNYRNLELVEREALGAVSRGAKFATVCEAVADSAEEPDRAVLIGRLLARWSADGILVPAEARLARVLYDRCPGAETQRFGPFSRNVERSLGVQE
jgi:hypothetical protein